MHSYLDQFVVIALAHFFAVMSPGPDFALIARQSFLYGRRISIYTSLGIAIGILFHVSYCILGLTIFISKYNWLFLLFKILCATYLLYLGFYSILFSSKKYIKDNISTSTKNINDLDSLVALKQGFITNVFNVKATFFFLSLYTYIEFSTPKILQILYGFWMSIITGIWFISLSCILTSPMRRKISNRYNVYINRIMGIVLIYIAINIYINY
jgi:threonine/homoserine/homoserine lactone efflux protein